jgi:hypothetical protein
MAVPILAHQGKGAKLLQKLLSASALPRSRCYDDRSSRVTSQLRAGGHPEPSSCEATCSGLSYRLGGEHAS